MRSGGGVRSWNSETQPSTQRRTSSSERTSYVVNSFETLYRTCSRFEHIVGLSYSAPMTDVGSVLDWKWQLIWGKCSRRLPYLSRVLSLFPGSDKIGSYRVVFLYLSSSNVFDFLLPHSHFVNHLLQLQPLHTNYYTLTITPLLLINKTITPLQNYVTR